HLRTGGESVILPRPQDSRSRAPRTNVIGSGPLKRQRTVVRPPRVSANDHAEIAGTVGPFRHRLRVGHHPRVLLTFLLRYIDRQGVTIVGA
ncbi:hypothetical protein BHE74_00059340, partial [Ensete ventricosum]